MWFLNVVNFLHKILSNIHYKKGTKVFQIAGTGFNLV